MKRGIAAGLILAAGIRVATLTELGDVLEDRLGRGAGEGFSATISLRLGEEEDLREEAAPSVEPVSAGVGKPEEPEQEPAPTPTPPLPENTPTVLAANLGSGLEIDNNTGFDIDIQSLLGQPLELTLPAEGPQILIIHTHGSEAYTQDAIDRYVETDPTRTDDINYNVVRVGDVLEVTLENFGLNVLHDRELYDYPSYSGSYSRSAAAIEAYLEQYPDIAVVIDLHRDALGSGDVVYKTMASLEGTHSSQVMLLAGTGENGLEHPKWRQNLHLALLMQQAMEEKYPSLARPVCVAQERYNQHLTAGSLILEVGSNGNTLQEAICAVRLFGDAVGPVLADLVE